MQEVFAQESIEEVSVTGSRISRDIGFESPVPVTAITQDEMRMFDPGLGAAAQLQNLPQFFNNVSSDNISGRVAADLGQSQLNMRGMGANRTLVLLDGMRIVPSDRRSSVSVDYLPTTLVQRVDVVTGGASAAYGADALAGVTNFVLNRNYTGMEVAYTTGINEVGDGEYNRGAITFGDDLIDGRLHVFGSVEARINDQYRRQNAAWDTRQGYVRNPAYTGVATPGVPLRLTRNNVYSANFSSTGLITAAGSALNRMQFNEAGTGVQPFDDGQLASFAGVGNLNTAVGTPGDYQYDLFIRSHPQSFERLGLEQQNVFIGSDFKLTEETTLWGHYLFGRSSTEQGAYTFGSGGVGLGHAGQAYTTIFRDNPFLPAAVRQTMINENRQSIRVDQHGLLDVPAGYMENVEVVNAINSLTLGFDTSLGRDWSLRGSWQRGIATKQNEGIRSERLDRFYLATDAVTDPQTGQPICRIQLVQRQLAAQGRNLEAELHAWAQANTKVFRSDLAAKTPGAPEPVDYPIGVDSIDGTISDCVPINSMGTGKQSQQALDYIHSSRNKTGISTQTLNFAEVLANGTLHEGWGAGPISAAIGANYRESYIAQYIVDDAIDALGAPCNVTLPDGTVVVRGVAPSINCSATADSLHRFSGQPEFKGGYDVYEAFTEASVPLFEANGGAQYAELSLAARLSQYSRAGDQLSWKTGLSLKLNEQLRLRGTLSHDIREGSFEELFVVQGRGANITDPWNGNITYQVFNQTGGNPDLKAEEAKTTVLGFVYQPDWLEGFSFSADRYVVDLSSAIGSFTEQQTIDTCLKNNVLCENIVYGSDGRIASIRVSFININAAKVSGYDFEASYRAEPDFFAGQTESLSLRMIAGYMDENSSTPLGGAKIDQAGSATIPDQTITGILRYNIGDFGLSLQHYWQDRTIRNVQWIEGIDVDNNSLASVNLTHLGLFYDRSTASGNWRLSLNVNNLFDRSPVLGGTTRIGDEQGRRYALGLNYTFN